MPSPGLFETARVSVRIEGSEEPALAVCRHLEDVGVWVLADAMGSKARAHRSPDRALDAFARVAAPVGHRASPSLEVLRQGIAAANAAVYDEDLPTLASPIFATSIVAAKIESGRLGVAHLGSARCYRFRAGDRSLLTPSHTVLATLRGGDDSSSFATHHRHLLTRALGMARQVEPELTEHAVRPGELLVLVNDSLAMAVEDPTVASLFIHDATASAVASCIASRGTEQGMEGEIVAIRILETADLGAATAGSYP